MNFRLIEFSQLTTDDIKRLANLHHSVMHTLLSDLGFAFVWRYYQVAQADPWVIGFCAVSTSNEMIGWAMGSPHPDRITSQLRSPFLWFAFQILRITLTRPIVLLQLISSVVSASDQTDVKKDAIELTYIGVAADQRGKRVGETLLHAFLEASRSHGYRSVALSVEKENLAAISLYEQAGFAVIKTFSEGRYQRHRMELTLV
jgi:ribosomal protein S18 acetylase RimI-like enzyme